MKDKNNPVIPNYTYDISTVEMTGIEYRTCPVCGKEVFKGDDKCEHCGQSLNWNEDE